MMSAHSRRADFLMRGSQYGDLGKGFIEAHRLRPIATLEEGTPVKYDVAADFAVLCSNCHRMIHRFSNPSDLVAFRSTSII
jgi:5-methylcytosine-specific restriction protein A